MCDTVSKLSVPEIHNIADDDDKYNNHDKGFKYDSSGSN